MHILELLIELVKATAWPITVIVLAFQFRTEFRALLGRLKKGKVGSAEFEFQEEVKELEKQVIEISATPGHFELRPEVIYQVELHPRAALLDAWIEIEKAMTNLAQQHELLNAQTRRNSSALVKSLAKDGLIPKSHVPAFIELRRLRNEAAHDADFKPSEEAVLGYLEVAEELKQLVIQATNKQ